MVPFTEYLYAEQTLAQQAVWDRDERDACSLYLDASVQGETWHTLLHVTAASPAECTVAGQINLCKGNALWESRGQTEPLPGSPWSRFGLALPFCLMESLVPSTSRFQFLFQV